MPGKNYTDRIPARCCDRCKYCFVHHDFDTMPSFYCTLNAMPRPWCGSVALGEPAYSLFDDDVWNRWADEYLVARHGVCDNFIIDHELEKNKHERDKTH